MEENDYLLVIKLPIKALDDAAARLFAKGELAYLGIADEEMQHVKLQRIVAGQSPEGIPL
jgi:hypothetical protein